MVKLLIGIKENGNKSKIKSNIVQSLSKNEKVCVVCSEENTDYYANMRWKSRKFNIENVQEIFVRQPLTVVSFKKLDSGEILDPNLIYRLFTKGFTSVFIDDSQYVLRGFIVSDGLNDFINEINSKYKDIQVTIACQQFEQLVHR